MRGGVADRTRGDYFLKKRALIRVNSAHCSGRSSSKKMASTGQTSAQTPQSMHSSGLMKYCSASSVEWMQSTGQTSTQLLSLTPIHGWAITYATAHRSLPCTQGDESTCATD